MALREEAFLDTTNIEATSGVAFGVTRPTKHASNPVALPAAASANQNYHILNGIGGSLLDDDSTVIAALGAKSGFTAIVPTYLTSTDGVTFTQPNLGLVTWAGSTANNVMHPTGVGDVANGTSSPEQRYSITAHFYDADSEQWVAMMRGWNTGFGAYLYTSPNPWGPWTLASTVYAYHLAFPSHDPNCLVQRPDGRWLAYGQRMSSGYPQTGIPNGYYAGRRRDLVCLLSDTTDLFGTWTDQGVVLSCAASNRQYYSATAWVSGETVCVAAWIFDGTDNVPAANTFNGTINRVHKIALYTGSDDGLTLTLADDDWLASTGSTSDWDGGEILTNGVPLVVGDETRFYFAADDATHHQDWVAQGNRRLLGLSTWGKNRLGKITGTGTARTSLITAATAATLTINSTGTVAVELLDASNNVITGYASADCDTIPADTYGHTVTWGGESATPSAFKVKLYLTSGTVYYLTADEVVADPAEGYGNTISSGYGTATSGAATLTIDPVSTAWEQVGTSITVRTTSDDEFAPTPATVTATVNSPAGGLLRFRGTDAARFAASVDGTTWASTVDIPAGENTIYLRVTPTAAGTTMSAEIGIPN